MNIETLEKTGLNANEAKVYLALLELGPSLAGKITERSKVNRRTVYDVLESLIDKGLVSYVIEASRKMFEAADPLRFLDILEERKKEIQEALPELRAKKEASGKKQEATIFRGKKGIKTIFQDILRHKEYWVFGSSGKFKEILGPFFSLFQKQIKEKRIKLRLLISETARETDIALHAQEVRFLPKEYTTLISTIVYSNKVAIVSWTENPVGFLLDDKQTADSYRTYFKFMWGIAKK